MKYEMYTLNREDITVFEDVLPEYVVDNCGKEGCFMIGAVDADDNLVGLAQFYVGMLENGEFVSDLVYIYVAEEYRGNGAASRMISKVHSILKQSGLEKSLALTEKKSEVKALFTENGYLFMKLEKDSVKELENVHDRIVPAKTEQGVCWLDR
ncbi:MAG: GNAT family N-acetyltransferase [Lachnospiraceae bacterium]|nr:GNAT family N-acetyltransferase [Lachnospiraceae bacterium]